MSGMRDKRSQRFKVKAIPMTFARLIHLERLADDARARAIVRREKMAAEAKRRARR
jgi:hypothetical protein